jgi:ATP-dependent helicase/nuclease subunit B
MRDLLTAVETAVRTLRAGDPFLPVSVVVPSRLLGSWLAPRLFAGSGHIAVAFVSLQEVAWRVAAPRLLLQGRKPIPENVDLALLLSVSGAAADSLETPDYLREAIAMRGFAPAALRTLQDLAGAGVTVDWLEASAPDAIDPLRLRLLARLTSRFSRRLAEERLIDRPTLFREAAQALPSPSLGGLVLCESGSLAPAALAFLDAVRSHHPFALVGAGCPAWVAPRSAGHEEQVRMRLGGAADTSESSPAPTSLGRLQAGLFVVRSASSTATPLDSSLRILAAAGESLEAVEIARIVQQAIAEGLRPSDIAVLLHDPGRYAANLASAFDRAGIEAFFIEGTPRIDPAARGLGLLLALVGQDLERRDVMEFLTSARIRWDRVLSKETERSPSRWDRMSAEAGIVAGHAMWTTRLKAKRAECVARGWPNDRDPALCDSLLEVIDRLASDLAAFPETGSTEELLGATLALLDGWIVQGELTRERLERVLGPMARYSPPTTREAFLSRVRDLLSTQTYREGGLDSNRVVVSRIDAVFGMVFSLVFIPGLVERAFPAPSRPDPLLLDEEREALSPDLLTSRDDTERERVLFWNAAASARARLVLSYPRYEASSGRLRTPSSFLLHAVEAATGTRIGLEGLARMASAGETGLGRPYPTSPDAAIDALERDLALVANGVRAEACHLLADGGTVARVVMLERATWTSHLTPYDGLIDVAADSGRLDRLRLAGHRSSASAVEAFAACPYKHLLARGLGLTEWEEPDRVYQLDGRAWGLLYHDAVSRLFEWMREGGLLPLRVADLAVAEGEMGRIVDACAERFSAEGGIVHPALLEPVKGKLKAELGELLEREAERVDDFVPTAFEQPFEGIEVEFHPGQTVTFRGRLDRVDRRPVPPTVRVVDYKTGPYAWRADEQFRGGRELQLALYNEAARHLFPEATVDEARYYHAVSTERFKFKPCPATQEVGETLHRVLRTLDETAHTGLFVPVADTCTFCPFTGVCGTSREMRAQRKKDDPRLASFLSLRQIP